jgi:cytochrome c oxidase subunit 3
MSFFRQLMEKSWENAGSAQLEGAAGPGLRSPAPRVGLVVFLCVVTVLFTLLIAAYAERMAFEDWRPTPQQWLLWLNTALLVMSSIAFQWAVVSVRRGRVDDTALGLIGAGFFAFAFLLGQLWAWRQVSATIGFDIAEPAIAFFYLITGLHGLHLLGGLVAWSRAIAELWHDPDMDRLARQVRLCATYWHFLLVLWLILFGLLFSGEDNLGFLLALCGLR